MYRFDRFQTYFPHIDNVYSHRSTQKYKRKPFVSHYWDCRLKGRPPGTPKSDDPNKKKRKRQARERDLCDVKIKITEFFEGARDILANETDSSNSNARSSNYLPSAQPRASIDTHHNERSLGSEGNDSNYRPSLPGSDGSRYYSIQRINGSNPSGKGETTTNGVHKHTLEESDRVKRNSVQRYFLKEEKVKRRTQVSCIFSCNSNSALSAHTTFWKFRVPFGPYEKEERVKPVWNREMTRSQRIMGSTPHRLVKALDQSC